jgi:aryl-alcohol dehydrogenase-like predicted oxidoreductase
LVDKKTLRRVFSSKKKGMQLDVEFYKSCALRKACREKHPRVEDGDKLLLTPRNLYPTDVMFGGIHIGPQRTPDRTGWIIGTQDHANEVVHAAIRAGIHHFDTAPMYSNGVAEERLGKALSTFSFVDEAISEMKLFVYTKVGRLIRHKDDSTKSLPLAVNSHQNSPKEQPNVAAPSGKGRRKSIATVPLRFPAPINNRVRVSAYDAKGAMASVAESSERLFGNDLIRACLAAGASYPFRFHFTLFDPLHFH